MFDKIIAYSVKNKFLIGLMMVALTIWGMYSIRQLPIDAVPDITNNQVQIITISPTLATQEIEQFITAPIELSLQSLQRIEEIRSTSRFGLSVITVVFDENYDIYLARQLVNERLIEAQDAIPDGLGTPEMAPLSTGLGEIYQYVVRPSEGYEDKYTAIELRTFQDWIVKRQLLGIEGVAEINSMGGYLKQYEVAVNPQLLKSMNLSITDVYEALVSSNENTGGAYIEKNSSAYYIRSEGLVRSLEDVENIVLTPAFQKNNNTQILIKDIATVRIGKAPRYGALVRDGKEVVGGKVMMFKGANSAKVTELVKERVLQVQKSLPEGVIVEPFLVRDKLVTTAMTTVEKNLIEGGLIVIFILILFLGNWRAGLIVASVIPFAMLFAVSMMNVLGISANLMSLGAIDFGLIVDGAVIIVEAIVHRLHIGYSGRRLSQKEMDEEVIGSSQRIRNSAAFGEIIILMVYIPILALVGIEGKMFKPMAQTVMLAITGALILSLTYVPMMSALFLSKQVSGQLTISDKIIQFFQRLYTPVLALAMRFKAMFVGVTLLLFFISIFVFSRMGGEFIPTLEEGDLAMQHILPPGSSLTQSVETAKMIQNKLLKNFPEIEDVVANIGSAEIPTDPMPVEIADYVLVMKPKSEWTSAKNRQEMFEIIEEALQVIPGVGYEFSQPIQLRFNELMTGVKSDIAIKLFGDNLDLLYRKAKEAEKVIGKIDGVGTVNVEQTIGMPQIIINYDYKKMAQYGLHVKEVNQVIRTAFAGEKAGVIFEGEKRFDLVLRLEESSRKGIQDVENIFVTLKNGEQIPLNTVATIQLKDAPMQVSRENTNRRIVIGVNVGNTDVESLVGQISTRLDEQVKLPIGYYFTYGGQFENLKAANARLAIALPLALALIFILLYFTFGSFAQAILIFTAIPLSAIGGIWALELRGLPFSISAGIGFIALFGVAVLNGIVLIGYLNQLKSEGVKDIKKRIFMGTTVRLRPVLMTAAVASFGFLPMAISTSGGAEVQRPLATVVIGGLISATLLTLLILPIFYFWVEKLKSPKMPPSLMVIIGLGLSFFAAPSHLNAQARSVSLEQAIEWAMSNHPSIKAAQLDVQKNKALQGMKYNLGPTSFSYQGDGMFKSNPEQVHQLGVVQSIPNRHGWRAKNQLQDKIMAQSAVNQSIMQNELRYQVRKSFVELQYKKELLSWYQELKTLYQTYFDLAKKRLDAGATNGLETLSIETKLRETEMLSEQLVLEINQLEASFQLLLQQDEPLTSDGKLSVLAINESEGQALALQKQQAIIQVEQAKIKRISAAVKPDYKLGYSAQNFFGVGWLSGVQAGISIPLFKGNNKQKVASQKINIAFAKAALQQKEIEYARRLSNVKSQILRYEEGAHFYQQQIESMGTEMLRIAWLNYQAGAISYLELMNSLQWVANIKQKYLEQLIAQNRAVILYQFLINQ